MFALLREIGWREFWREVIVDHFSALRHWPRWWWQSQADFCLMVRFKLRTFGISEGELQSLRYRAERRMQWRLKVDPQYRAECAAWDLVLEYLNPDRQKEYSPDVQSRGENPTD